MSSVGPRPPLPREVEQYDAYTFQRLYVTPGLSCYWQIQPHRNELSFEEWVDLDIKYIRERSFITDWKIIFRTVAVMLHQTGRVSERIRARGNPVLFLLRRKLHKKLSACVGL